MKEKIIIALRNVSNQGKTSTIKEIAKLIISQYNINMKIDEKNEINIQLNINGVDIAIISQGDPSTGLKDKLNNAIKNCKVVICATRTSGETVEAVNSISQIYDAEVIWTSTYSTDKKNKSLLDKVNQIKARQIVDLLIELKYIN